MKITLRKASALQTSINEAIKSIRLDSDIRINEFQNGETEVIAARNTLLANINRKIELTNVLYAIRKEVAQANVTAGIDLYLTEVANIEKNIQIYTEAINSRVRESAAVLQGKLTKLRTADTARSIYRDEEVVSGVVTEGDIKDFRQFLAQAKKAKQKIQDQILEANVRTEITFDGYVVEVLKAENLL